MAGRSDCIFCKIIAQEIPASIIYEDSHIIAFADINPVASEHLLIVPKEHIQSLADVSMDNCSLLGQIQVVAAQLAKETGVASSGFRLVCNCGINGGQTVDHLHYHLIGGRKLQWPPG